MSRSVEVFQVDAFTTQPFTGNPAGVVLGAEILSGEEMQLIARELNNGDTAFIGAPQGADHDHTVRFFTPRTEAAFVGHATLAAHAVLQSRTPRDARRLRGQGGVVEATALPKGMGFRIRQSPAPLGRGLSDVERDRVLELTGLSPGQLDHACPPRIAGKGSTRLLVALQSAADLQSIAPRLDALAALSGPLGAQGYFFFTRHPDVAGCSTESRMFCPALGIAEDPVSGNAHGMLGHYLFELGLLEVKAGRAAFTGAQGHHVARPGRVAVDVEVGPDGEAAAVGIAGSAVVVFQTRIGL